MDDTIRRGILAMLLFLTSGLPLMFTGPLLADEPVPGATSDRAPGHLQNAVIASVRSGAPGAGPVETYLSPATRQ